MNKLFMSFFIIIVISFHNAQAQDRKHGLKAGINYFSLGGDVEDNSAKIGFLAGGYADLMVTDFFRIQPEILYSLQRTSVRSNNEDILFKFSYLAVPLSAKIYPVKTVYLQAGPQLGVLLIGKGIAPNGEKEDIKDFFKSTDVGIIVGAGYEFEAGINFNIRYIIGLTNIADRFQPGTTIKSRIIQLSAGYSF